MPPCSESASGIQRGNSLQGCTPAASNASSGIHAISASLPAWLNGPPGSGSGNGPADTPLSADSTGLAAGRYTDDIELDAPATDNGGATVPATLQVHEVLARSVLQAHAEPIHRKI